MKLLRALNGRKVTASHGLAESLEQLAAEPPEFSTRVAAFIDGLISHYVLDDGELVVTHAGLPENMQGRSSGAVRSFSLYGDTTGETDEYGLPVRYPWAEDYRGKATVVYGHTPVPEAVWLNRTICIDTGCVFGGRLTALRYPEKELVSVPAHQMYWEPAKPLQPVQPVQDAREGTDLDLEDVVGKRILETRLTTSITIREENAIAALEVMSRFAVDPRWLAYLPPTMSPTATSDREGMLEHPHEAFAAFRAAGVEQVVCEEKHMGSRAIAVVCREPSVARAAVRHRVAGRRGHLHPDRPALLHRRRARAASSSSASAPGSTAAGLWDELGTEWLILDCELMPWSAKAEELLRRQYAPVGAAAARAVRAELAIVEAAGQRGVDVADLLSHMDERASMVDGFIDAYREYCWPVVTLDDLKLAPFQILAGEGRVYALRDHLWHLEILGRLTATRSGDVPGDPVDHRRCQRRAIGRRSHRLVGGAHGRRRRGDGGEADRGGPQRARTDWPSPGSRCAAASTCGSSTGRSTPPSVICRACVPAGSVASGRSPSGSSPSASSRWNASWPASRSTGCTSASSASWLWRASRSTPACSYRARRPPNSVRTHRWKPGMGFSQVGGSRASRAMTVSLRPGGRRLSAGCCGMVDHLGTAPCES